MRSARRTIAFFIALWLVLLPQRAWAHSALGRVAKELGRGITGATQTTTVAVAPLKTDVRAPKAQALVTTLGRLIAGAVGGGVQVAPAPMKLHEARHFVGRKRRLVHVLPVIERGLLRVSVNIYDRMPTVWQRAKGLSYPVGHAFASARIDAELRGYLEPIELERMSVHRFAHGERDVGAVACGDVSGDGVIELVIVSEERITVGRLDKGKFVPRRHRDWNAIVPKRPVGLRKNIASAVVLADRSNASLAVGTTERPGVLLDGNLGVRGELGGLPLGERGGLVCAALRTDSAVLAPGMFPCEGTAKENKRGVIKTDGAFDTAALALVDAPGGKSIAAMATRTPRGKVVVKANAADFKLPSGLGAQLALGDANQDGVIEVATTLDERAQDAITLYSLEPKGPVSKKTISAPGGVRALAFCPPERRGIPALVAVVEDEVWLVR